MRTKRERDGRVHVEFVVGGSGHAYVPASRAGVCVVVDSRDELGRIPDLPHVVKISLGDHETVLTLLDRTRAYDAEAATLYDEYRHLPNVHLSSGMAQDPRLGACAIRDLAQTGLLDQYLHQIFVRLFEIANGQLSQVVIREVNSQAGGMGSAGGPEIGARFREDVERHTHAPITQHMVRIGGTTFLAIAKRAASNTAYATRRNLDSLTASSAPRVIRDAEFIELPLRNQDFVPLRDNRELRDGLAGPALAALCNEELRAELDSREVNHKPESTLGEARTIRAKWSNSLDQNQLTRAAATEYRERLADFRKQCESPEMAIVNGVRVDLTAIGSAPSLESLSTAVRHGLVHDPLFDALANADVPQFRAEVFVETSRDRILAIDEMLHGLARPTTLTDVRDAIRRFRGMTAHLSQALSKAEDTQRSADATLEKRRSFVSRELRRLRSPFRTVEMALSPKTLVRRATGVFSGLVDALDQAARARARAAALKGALERVRSDCTAYEHTWIVDVELMLEHFIDRRPLRSTAFEVQSLDTMYPDLIEATARLHGSVGIQGYLKAVLLRAVSRVTFAGLAEMLRTEPDPEAIVAAFEQDKFAWTSPMWGGGGRTAAIEPREQFVVLPPVSAGDLAAMRSVGTQRRFVPMFVAAESVLAGCCVVALDFYPVIDRADLEMPLYSASKSAVAPAQHVM